MAKASRQSGSQAGRQADDMRHHNVITYCSTLSVEIWTSSRWASAYGKYAHVRGPSVFIYLCEHAKQSIESLFANHTPELKCNAFQSTTIVRTFAHTLSYRSNRIPFKIIMCARWFYSVSFLLSGSLIFAPLLFICQSVWIFLICMGESKRKETTSKSIIAFPMNVAILLVFLNCYLDFWHRFCHRQIKKIPLYAKQAYHSIFRLNVNKWKAVWETHMQRERGERERKKNKLKTSMKLSHWLEIHVINVNLYISMAMSIESNVFNCLFIVQRKLSFNSWVWALLILLSVHTYYLYYMFQSTSPNNAMGQ